MLKSLVTFSTEIPNIEEMEINKTYMLTLADGIYRYKKTHLMLVKEKVETFENKLFGLSNGSEGIQLLIPKVPFKLWLMSLDFFKDIYKRDNTEASTIIYYIQDTEKYREFFESLTSKEKASILVYKDFLIQAPLQVNENLLTQFGECPLYNKLSDMKGIVKVIELHSHHVMDAFWSNTDNRNQNEDCFYGVFGKLDKEDNFLMKYVIQGSNVDTNVETLFHFPKLVVTSTVDVDKYKDLISLNIKPKSKKIPFEGVFPNNSTYPKEWLDMAIVKGLNKVDNDRESRSQYWGSVFSTEEVEKEKNVIKDDMGNQLVIANTAKSASDLFVEQLRELRREWSDYIQTETIKPRHTDYTLYTKLELTRIYSYYTQMCRILAIDYIFSNWFSDDSVETEAEFVKTLNGLNNLTAFLGKFGKKYQQLYEYKYIDMVESIQKYFDRANYLNPIIEITNLAEKYQMSKFPNTI